MLEGIRVLSFTHFLQGPSAVQILADMGAEVIKVEIPSGPYERNWAGMDTWINGMSMFFLMANRNQRSLAVDMSTGEGREIIERLLAQTDVVVQNFRPGVLEKYGFGCDDVRERYPKIVYCNCSGFGTTGPYKERPGQDLIVQGLSGLASLNGRSDSPPTAIGAPVVDQHGAVLAALGVVAALFDRQRTGNGHVVDSSLLGAAMDLQLEPFNYFLNQGRVYDKLPTGTSARCYQTPYGVYQTADDYIILSATPIDKLKKIFGDEHFAGFTQAEVHARRTEIDRIVADRMKTKTTDEWIPIFEENKAWHSRISEYPEVEKDPQLQFNEMIQTVDHPVAGRYRVLLHPVKFDGKNLPIRKVPPCLGEHTREIMKEVGYSDPEIEHILASRAAVSYQ
jgi:crotonobetainyl-CoA:carnitine CoA-transferase CaiB-like acyl-CoA transferase